MMWHFFADGGVITRFSWTTYAATLTNTTTLWLSQDRYDISDMKKISLNLFFAKEKVVTRVSSGGQELCGLLLGTTPLVNSSQEVSWSPVMIR